MPLKEKKKMKNTMKRTVSMTMAVVMVKSDMLRAFELPAMDELNA